MKKHRLLQIIVVVMLLALAASGVAVQSASADEAAPFRASISGTVSLTSAETFELVGTVKANHIGNRRNYRADGVFTGPNTNVLTETLTAANGDTLVIRCDQVLEEISPGVFRGTDTWTIIGGTGRFSEANGSGTGETIANLNSGTFTKELNGIIDMPDDD